MGEGLDAIESRLRDEATRQRFIAFFKVILRRTPDEASIVHHMRLLDRMSLAEICLALAESAEAKSLLRPRPVRIGSIAFVMVSRGIDDHARAVLDAVAQDLRPGDDIIVIDRSTGEWVGFDAPQTTILRRPGATVFQCRAEFCSLGANQEWLALLEDHNVPVDNWMRVLRETLAALPPELSFVSGAVDNRQSRDFWSWCSYLVTFSRHWPPMQAGVGLPGIANVILRRSALPPGPYEIGQFEMQVLPALAAAGVSAPALIVDHVQPVDLEEALLMHINNARAIGGLARRLVPDPVAHLAAAEKIFVAQRPADIAAICRARPGPHPAAAVDEGVRLILRATFGGYATGMMKGVGERMHEVD